MGDKEGVIGVESARVRCAGDAAGPHAPVELMLTRVAVTACPLCGRRFRRIRTGDAIEPAIWPEKD
jgi:hypothetical protein